MGSVAVLRVVGLILATGGWLGCGAESDPEPADASPAARDAAGPCTSQCGNGTRECLEQCDDGNTRPGDGCSPTCKREPVDAGVADR
jgi:cysteine-rich repeat protein